MKLAVLALTGGLWTAGLAGCGDRAQAPAIKAAIAPTEQEAQMRLLLTKGVWSLQKWKDLKAPHLNLKVMYLHFKPDGTFGFYSEGSGSLEGEYAIGGGTWALQGQVLIVAGNGSLRETLVQVTEKEAVFSPDPVLLKDRMTPGRSVYYRARHLGTLPSRPPPEPASSPKEKGS